MTDTASALTATATDTPALTATVPPTLTATPTPSATGGVAPTASPTILGSVTPTVPASASLTASPSAAATVAATLAPSATATETATATPSPSPTPVVSPSLLSAPLAFEPNLGQTDPSVAFLAHGTHYGVYLSATDVELALVSTPGGVPANGRMVPASTAPSSSALTPTQETAVRLHFVGADATAQPTGLDSLPGSVNYLLGNDPSAWITGVPTYAEVAVQSIYPGIDLRYHSTDGQVEYDWELAAGADPGVIQVAFQGVSSLSLDAEGNLHLHTAAGPLQQAAAVAYQMVNGQQQNVSVQYVLTGQNQVGFTLGSYDPSLPLTIDPVLSYATYLGGNNSTMATSIAVDSQGNSYITGFTYATNYITTTGVVSPSYAGNGDAFVTKLNPSGSAVLYSTYLGGSGNDEGYHVVVDGSGDASIAGLTTSTDFPRYHALQNTYGTNQDAFVTTLNPTGTGFVYSTYLGGSGLDFAYGLAVDGAGDLYATGGTQSSDFITTTGTLQGALKGVQNAFVTKLDPSKSGTSSLLYSTYLGGSGTPYGDRGNDIVVDSAHNVYVVGDTTSSDFPHTTNALQPSYGGSDEGFMTELDASGSHALYSTFIGTFAADVAVADALDSSGNVYVAGESRSFSFPFSSLDPGAYQPGTNGGNDAFVTVLNPAKSGNASLVYTTFLGGFGDDAAAAIAVDSLGDAYLTGYDNTSAFGTKPFPYVHRLQEVPTSDVATAFVAELNPSGSALLFSTPIGGSGDGDPSNPDVGYGLALDGQGNVYVAGVTVSPDFPVASALQPTEPPCEAAFVAKIAPLASGGTLPWHPHHDISLMAGLDLSIDLADGHVDLHGQDMRIPARGPDLVVGHTWDSQLGQAGLSSAAGQGWVSDLTPRMGSVTGLLTGTIVYTDSTGAAWPFRYTGSLSATPPFTTYATPPGLPWELITSASGYELLNVLSGEQLLFDSQGRYLQDKDSYANTNTLIFTSTADTPVTVTNSGGRALSLYYTGAGQLSAVQSPLHRARGGAQGQLTAYGFNGSGQLTSQVWGYQTSDQVLASYGYSGTQLTSVTAGIGDGSSGHTWTLGYDGQGRLSSVTSPVSGSVGQAGYTPAYTTQLTYNEGQTQLVEGTGASGALTTTYTLDGAGEPLITQDGLGHSSRATYDANHDVLTSTDQNNNTTTSYYQPAAPISSVGLVTETVQPAIQPYSPLNGGMDNPTTFYHYNATTNDLIQTDPPEGGIIGYGYDAHHSVMTTTELLAAGTWRGTVNAYDGYGELSAVTDGRGVTALGPAAAYLNAQASQYTRHTSYTTQGDVQTQSTAPITTTLNGTLQVNTPVTTTYGYDADGDQTGMISPNGALSGEGYDHLGRLVTASQPQVTLYTGQNVYPTQTTQYDSNGNVAQQTDGNGDVTLDSYDPMQRLVAETNPISGTTVYTYNATEQTAVRDPAGNPTSYQYDAAGRLITETAPLTGTTLFQYDPAGNTTAITTQDTNTGTPIQVEQQGYDSLDRVLTDTISGPSQPPTTTLTRYDHNGNVFQVQQPNGDVVVNTYDLADQLKSTQLYMAPISGPSGATGPSYDAYSYDPAGNVTDHYDADNRHTTTSYDGDNRVTQSLDVTTTGTITTTPQYDPDSNVLTQTMQTVDLTQPGVQQTHTLTSTYNAADWLMSTGDDGLVSSYQYDAAGQQRTETILNGQTPVTAVLDPEGRATAIGENLGGTGPYSSTFGYNQDDLPLTVTLHSDTPSKQVQQSAQYDANSELTHLTASGPSGVANPLSSAYDYAYNAAGWTTAMTWTINTTGTNVVTATQIGHNALGRVTSWTGQIHGPESWAYDGNGNIIANTEFISDAIRTTAFTYSQTTPNQLDQQQTQGLGVEYFSYDQHGDTTSLTSTDPLRYPNGQLDPYHVNIHVGYDSEERPLTVTTLMDGAPITATLAYNADGLRSRYTVISGTATLRDEHFQYRDGLLGQDVVISGTQTYTDTFIYDQGGAPLELIRQQGATTSRYWYVLDGRNNVVALTDNNGNVVDRYAYDLWGEGLPEGTSETVRQPLRYGGYWWDQEVGWYWVATRYYDPEGRWLQPDPSEQDGAHTYVYVNDDPIDSSDQSGFCANGLWICPWEWIGQQKDNFLALAGDPTVIYAPASEQDLAHREHADRGRGKGGSDQVADVVLFFGAPEGKLAGYLIDTVGKKLVGTIASKITPGLVTRLIRAGLHVITGGCTCFPASATVETPHGQRAIASLHMGDQVLSEDPAKGTVEPEPIQAVIDDGAKPLMSFTLSDGSAITVTTDHPFWVDSGRMFVGPGWLPAGLLRVGDHLRTATGSDVIVAGVRYNVGRAEVYTLTVAHDHTFFVGEARILVHNAVGCSSRILGRNLEDIWGYRPAYVAAHHIVADGDKRADEARKILAGFDLTDLNIPQNGVYLPRYLKSPNFNGTAVVHSIVHTQRYYDEVTSLLREAKTPADAMNTLTKIGKELLAGTFPF